MVVVSKFGQQQAAACPGCECSAMLLFPLAILSSLNNSNNAILVVVVVHAKTIEVVTVVCEKTILLLPS